MTELVLSQADGDPGAYDTLILGIGNILWADEGFGIRSVETLHERYTFPEDVRVLDGGTQGIFLVPWVTNARRLLIFDAIDFGLEPGTLKIIHGADVPRFMGAKKMSMHQTGFQEVLAMADLTGDLPEELALVGVQPELLDDFGGSLTDCVKAQIDAVAGGQAGVGHDDRFVVGCQHLGGEDLNLFDGSGGAGALDEITDFEGPEDDH